jgi:hypothetical protein
MFFTLAQNPWPAPLRPSADDEDLAYGFDPSYVIVNVSH